MAVSLTELWIPILLGTVLVWIASSIIHMALGYHNSDYQTLPNEDEVMEAVGRQSLPRGLHAFPHAVGMADMKDPAVQEKFARGPVGFLLVLPNGMPNIGKLLGLQIAHQLGAVLLVAYCVALALPPGTGYWDVFRMGMTAGFLAFGWASIPYSIWYGFQWSSTGKHLLDAVIYGALTGGTLAGFWPTPVS